MKMVLALARFILKTNASAGPGGELDYKVASYREIKSNLVTQAKGSEHRQKWVVELMAK